MEDREYQKQFVKIEDENGYVEPVYMWNESFGMDSVHISWSDAVGEEHDTMIEMHLVPIVIKELQRRYDEWKRQS